MKHLRLSVLLFAVTLSAVAAGRSVSLSDYASDRAGDDWSPALSLALSQADTVLVPAGTYKISAVSLPSGKTIIGEGHRTVFVALSSAVFSSEGVTGKAIPIEEDIVDFSSTIVVRNAEFLRPGDVILLRSQRNCMVKEDCGEWALGQTVVNHKTCFYGEFLEVSSIDGGKISLKSSPVFPFYKKDCSAESVRDGFATRPCSTVQKMTLVENVTLKNFDVATNASCNSVLCFKAARNCMAENITAFNNEPFAKSSRLFVLQNCISCKLVSCTSFCTPEMKESALKGFEKTYENYGKYNNFRLMSCTDCSLESCNDNFATHAFSITYSGMPSIRCRIVGCKSIDSIWAGVISQQNTPWSELVANTVINAGQGVFAGCRWSKVMNNYVKTDLPFSTNHYYTHLSRGGTVGIGLFEGYARSCVVSGNTVSGFYTGISVHDGYEKLNVFDDYSDIVIKGNKVSGCVQGFLVSKNKYNVRRAELGITLENNSFKGVGYEITIDGNIRSGFGVRLPGCSGVTVTGNDISDYKFGVHMNSFPDSIFVEGNRIGICRYGVYLSKEESNPERLVSHLRIRKNSMFEIEKDEYGGFSQPFVKMIK